MTPNEINAAISQIRNKYSGMQGGADLAYQEMADFARARGLDAGAIAEATGRDVGHIQNLMSAYAPNQYGLAPAVQSFQGGIDQAVNTLGQGRTQALDALQTNFNQGLAGLNQRTDQAIGYMQPYAETGGQAFNVQAALSGALGGDAQAQAFQNFQASPGQQYLQEQAERALLRNASAIGGLGGGAVRNELQRHAIGMASQDFGNQFARLGQVSGQGMQAAGVQAGLAGNAGNAAFSGFQNLGGALAGVNQDVAAGQAAAQMGGANIIGQNQMQAGRDLSANVGGTSSALATLMQRQGMGAADILSANTSNLANLLSGYYGGEATSLQDLAAQLVNQGMNAASSYAGQPIVPGPQSNYLGILGNTANAVAGTMYGLNQAGVFNNQSPVGVNTGYNTVPGYGPSYTGTYNPAAYLGGMV